MEYKEPIPKQDYKVLVRCITFNQSKYIEDALNGFVMQKTNFPYICTIVDDCSTDGEQEVIKAYLNNEFDISVAEYYETEYANITIAPHKTNPNCTFAVYFLKYNHYSKKQKKGPYLQQWRNHCEYEAICEGDDYWIVEDKLQKQVEYLDSNKDCVLCFHNVNVLSFEDKDKTLYRHLKSKNYSGNEVLERWTIPTCSVVYRKECLSKVPVDKRFNVGDNVLFLTCASLGKLYCVNEIMGCYRRVATGWTANNIGLESLYKSLHHQLALKEHFPQFSKSINYIINRYYIRIAKKMLGKHDIKAFKYIFKSVILHPIMSMSQIIKEKNR